MSIDSGYYYFPGQKASHQKISLKGQGLEPSPLSLGVGYVKAQATYNAPRVQPIAINAPKSFKKRMRRICELNP